MIEFSMRLVELVEAASFELLICATENVGPLGGLDQSLFI